MDDMIRRDTAIDELERIRYKLWEIDIPSPTVPEYIEHHEQVQSVMQAVTESVDRIWKEPAQPENIHCQNCKYSEYDALYGDRYCHCNGKAEIVPDSHYCGYGERRTDGQI